MVTHPKKAKHLPRRAASFLLALLIVCTMLPQRAKATPTAYETMLTRLTALESLASQYRTDKNVSTSVDQLVLSYIRSASYSSTTWNLLAGTADSAFLSYVAQKSPDTAALRSTGALLLPNGDTTDFIHMFAVLNMLLTGYGDLGGWMGDTCQMILDFQSASGETEELTAIAKTHFRINGHFGLSDWIADVDAYNLYHSKKSDESWSACLSRYFTASLTEKERCAKFIQSRLGSSYTKETSSLEKYRSAVKSAYSGTAMMSTLESSMFGSSPAQKYRDAACYAVADYLYSAVCAPQPDGTSVSINYAAETLRIAAGFTVNSSEAFDGTAYASGDTVTPGTVFYARGSRNPSAYSFFPSETVCFTAPQRPDTPDAPQLSEASAGSLTLQAIAGAEYSIDGGETWQQSPVFGGLVPHTAYSVICRIGATDSAFRSEVSPALEAETALPEGIYASASAAYLTDTDGVSALIAAAYDAEGRMTEIRFGTLADGLWTCPLPACRTLGELRIFALGADFAPLIVHATVSK